MAKKNELYVCSNTSCNAEYTKWHGKCPSCNEFNTVNLVEGTIASKKAKTSEIMNHSGYAGRTGFGKIQVLSDVEMLEFQKIKTGFNELDRVMSGGDGVVNGSVTLIGGDPGIGKSTILIQTVGHMADVENKKVLYVSGEESLTQIKMRADRLKLNTKKLYMLSETNIENILGEVAKFKPDVLIIDSIQTMFTTSSTSKPGSVSQLRDTTQMLTTFSKTNNVTTFVIGHVTKGGDIAGPKVLEHIVDTVLYFEGEKDSKFRILRSIKNRFGEVNEIAVFSMEEEGLREETNPSAIFLNKTDEAYPGSVIVVAREGSKNLLIEVQALVSETGAENTQKRAIGLDRDRLPMIIATIQKRIGIPLWKFDIFTSTVGGMKFTEPAMDISIALAILSSYLEKTLPQDLAVFGEIGLSGEIRSVLSGEERIKESMKQGQKQFLIPKGNMPKNKKLLNEIKEKGVKIETASSLLDVINFLERIGK